MGLWDVTDGYRLAESNEDHNKVFEIFSKVTPATPTPNYNKRELY